MGSIRNSPWPDEAWMTHEQLAEAKAKRAEERAAAIAAAGGYRFIEQMTEAEEEAFYARYDRGMAGAVIAHRSPPASRKPR